jgi:hypothetical protein
MLFGIAVAREMPLLVESRVDEFVRKLTAGDRQSR